jgi:hypothetical protein
MMPSYVNSSTICSSSGPIARTLNCSAASEKEKRRYSMVISVKMGLDAGVDISHRKNKDMHVLGSGRTLCTFCGSRLRSRVETSTFRHSLRNAFQDTSVGI